MTNNHNASPNQSGNTEPEITEQMQAFYQRADAIIELANSQLSPQSHSGASVASIGFVKGDDLLKEKEDIIEFYAKQYRQMLNDNLEDYANNFDDYVQLNQQN